MQILALFVCLAGCRVDASRYLAVGPLPPKVAPDKVTVDGEGRLVGRAPDGFYAVYRGQEYRGDVKRRGAYLTPMYCCSEVEAGDTLEKRSQRRFLDVSADFVVGRFHRGLTSEYRSGPGLHVRYYALDGGLQLGAEADAYVSSARGNVYKLVTGELGWGMRVAPGLIVSANAGLGRATHYNLPEGEAIRIDTIAVIPTIRVQTFFTTFLFVSADVGVAIFDYGGRTDDYGAVHPYPPAPISRITVGIDL